MVDPSLKDYQGHHAEYDLAVSRGLLARGIESVVLCHRAALIDADKNQQLVPVYSKTMWEYGERQPPPSSLLYYIATLPVLILVKAARALRSIIPEILWNPKLWKYLLPSALKINLIRRGDLVWFESKIWAKGLELLALLPGGHFQQETFSAFRKIGLQKGDQVFFHMVIGPVFLPVLLCSYWAFKKTLIPPVVLLRYPPSFFKFLSFKDKWAWKSAEFLSEKGFLRLASDSHRLIHEFSEYSHAPFEMFPLPHGRAHRNIGGTRQHVLKIGYLGDARREKGFNELVQVVGDLVRRKQSGVRFCLQVFSPDAQCLKATEVIRQMAKNARCIELHDTVLSPQKYSELLQSLDVVVALYDPEIYKSRTSGICLDAWSAGKWVISTANTWAEDWAIGLNLPGRFCRNQSARELKYAIESILQSKEKTKACPQFKAFHNAESFADHLLGKQVSSLVRPQGLVYYPWDDVDLPATGAGWVNKVFAGTLRGTAKEVKFISEGDSKKNNFKIKMGYVHNSLLGKAITYLQASENPARELLARFNRKFSKTEKRFFNQILTQSAICLIHYPFIVKQLEPWLRKKPGKVVTIHHDLLYLKIKNPALCKTLLRKTRDACQIADKNIFISKKEWKSFISDAQSKLKNCVFANPANLIIEEMRLRRIASPMRWCGKSEEHSCVFYGSQAPENEEALFFFNLASQKSKDAGLDLRFRVLGGIAKTATKKYPLLDSYVKLSDEEFLETIVQSNFCYFPMMSGTGISIKTMEALALRKCVVGTSLAFRGIEGKNLRDCFEISNPQKPPLQVFEGILKLNTGTKL